MSLRACNGLLHCLLLAVGLAGCAADQELPGRAGAGGSSGRAGSGEAANGGMSGAAGAAGSAGSAGGSPTQPDVDAILKGGCATSTVKSSLLPSNILFVIDRSGSMVCNPPPTTASPDCELNPERADPNTPSKWELTSMALLSALKVLPADTKIGVSYFSNDDSCGVNPTPSVPLAENTAALQSTIEASLRNITPKGGTPIVGATILAFKHLHAQALSGAIFGNEFVVLLTDGQQSEQCDDPPTCTGAAECTAVLVDHEVPRAAAPGVGIRTFVIGAPGSEGAIKVLSQIAVAGGTAKPGCDPNLGNCHFDMTKSANLGKDLADALAQVAGQTNTCELPVPKPDKGTLDPGLVNVIYSPSNGKAALVLQDKVPPCDGGANGWQYTADDTKIRLCGAICDSVRADKGGRVDVVLGCPVQGPS